MPLLRRWPLFIAPTSSADRASVWTSGRLQDLTLSYLLCQGRGGGENVKCGRPVAGEGDCMRRARVELREEDRGGGGGGCG